MANDKLFHTTDPRWQNDFYKQLDDGISTCDLFLVVLVGFIFETKSCRSGLFRDMTFTLNAAKFWFAVLVVKQHFNHKKDKH